MSYLIKERNRQEPTLSVTIGSLARQMQSRRPADVCCPQTCWMWRPTSRQQAASGLCWYLKMTNVTACSQNQYGGPSDAVAVDFSGHTYFSYINHKHLTQLLAHIIPPPLSSPLVMIIWYNNRYTTAVSYISSPRLQKAGLRTTTRHQPGCVRLFANVVAGWCIKHLI